MGPPGCVIWPSPASGSWVPSSWAVWKEAGEGHQVWVQHSRVVGIPLGAQFRKVPHLLLTAPHKTLERLPHFTDRRKDLLMSPICALGSSPPQRLWGRLVGQGSTIAGWGRQLTSPGDMDVQTWRSPGGICSGGPDLGRAAGQGPEASGWLTCAPRLQATTSTVPWSPPT